MPAYRRAQRAPLSLVAEEAARGRRDATQLCGPLLWRVWDLCHFATAVDGLLNDRDATLPAC
ncbi:hypothetical protein L3i23_20170 [Herbiconiux sp. L3-i23]|nr:hypothetical protein L3i23_20170 [Herbiconiux sp. L3-i23]